MAHPALVASERFDERYDLYRTPEGGYSIEFARRLEGAPKRDPVGTNPVAVALNYDDILARIDPLGDEAIYLVNDGVRAYRVLRLAVPTAEGRSCQQACQECSSPHETSPIQSRTATSVGGSRRRKRPWENSWTVGC